MYGKNVMYLNSHTMLNVLSSGAVVPINLKISFNENYTEDLGHSQSDAYMEKEKTVKNSVSVELILTI